MTPTDTLTHLEARADSRLQRLPDTRPIPGWCTFSAQAEDDIHEITGGEA
jgi:hypothetical protein